MRVLRVMGLAVLLAAGCESTPAGLATDGAAEDAVALPDRGPDAPVVCGQSPATEDQGLLAAGTPLAGVALPACTVHQLAFVGAEGSTLKLEVRVPEGPALEVAIAYPDTGSFTQRLAHLSAPPGGGTSVLAFTPPRSGEFFLFVRSTVATSAAAYDLALSCTGGCDREATRFPIVLVHGWTGWDSIASWEYFYQVPETLQALGYLVTVVTLDPYNSIEKRSSQLAPQVDQALVDGHARQVDLIAHSQGGLDSRRLITTMGYADRVSSLVMVSTPNQGTYICDAAMGYVGGVGVDMSSVLFNLLGAAVSQQSDAKASFHDLSEMYVQGTFNQITPDDPRVSYVSWAGQTCDVTGSCGAPVHLEIEAPYLLLQSHSGDNDGIVAVSSAPWGDYRGSFQADHFDEVGQLFGATGSFDHKLFYTTLARDLVIEGH